jgi:hypothetical protein
MMHNREHPEGKLRIERSEVIFRKNINVFEEMKIHLLVMVAPITGGSRDFRGAVRE